MPADGSKGELDLAEHAAARSTELLRDSLPVGAVLLDWELKVVCWNSSGAELCERWWYKSPGLETADSGGAPHVPSELLEHCRPGSEVSLRHPQNQTLRATVSIMGTAIVPERAMFLIRFEDCRSFRAAHTSPDALRKLSACEREVALLVSQGCSNEEVAQQLGKSVLTVKKQLRAIYQKLKVKNRGRLGALIH